MKKELLEFKKHVEKYDFKNIGIKFKYNHSIVLMKIGNSIAKKLKLKDNEFYMVTLACLLHDIGRFDQLKIYDTFNDKKSFDHGDYAYNYIKKNNYLRKYTDDTTYDTAILKSIKYHNKFKIGKCNEIELLFSKIVRDADKVDILLNDGFKKFSEYETNELEISDSVYNKILNEKDISYDDTNNKLDRILLGLAMIYDINFDCSFSFIKGKGIVKRVIGFLKAKNKNKDTLDKLNIIEKKLEEYIERRVNNGKKV
ncbi:MAG: HD domain-containing protein [Bacilli bacterium]|nr:HD domain-containing protein [Bacilli bacterium]